MKLTLRASLEASIARANRLLSVILYFIWKGRTHTKDLTARYTQHQEQDLIGSLSMKSRLMRRQQKNRI